jgi:hypothetical protein
MSAWTWVLIGLSAAGVLLALAPVIPLLRLALRLRSRMNHLQNARLFTSLESFDVQRKHFEHVAQEADSLAQRAQRAMEQLRASANESGYAQMQDALRSAGEELSQLLVALR